MSLPEKFLERLHEIYPQDAERIIGTFERKKELSFRINPLRADPQAVLKKLLEMGVEPKPLEWYSYAYRTDAKFKELLSRSELFENGEIYIQSLSSMLAPLLLAPEPGETVLDLTAAPGGKSLMIAAMMRNSGWLSAVEPGKDRFFRLKANLERGGVEIAHLYMTDGRSVGAKCPAMFDRVLLDAPCTTEAKFKSFDPKSYAYWSERKIKEMSKLQNRLMISAVKSLKPGGTLLYATCSFEPEENEAVVDKALKKFPNLRIEPIDMPVENARPGFTSWRKKGFDPSLENSVRIVPDDTMEGFFLAKLRLQR